VWVAVTGQELLALKGHTRPVSCVAFSPDGKRIVSGSWDTTLKVWEAHTGQEVLSLKGHTLPVYCVAFSPDGKRIVSGGGNYSDAQGRLLPGEVKVWEADKGQEVLPLQGHTGEVTCVPHLAAWGQLLAKQPDEARPGVQQNLRHWQQDADFAGVRGATLTRLPEAERQTWQPLWADVEQTLRRADHQDTRDTQKKSPQ
jgi:hypothetical protein